ncbi:uncharacterized protein MYCFIDRAFT_172432 [Pseudocercospora fijiensis CIRAD86]|uniref:Uncharacterized protein n=1 Tax=Pseudocercospora fijiensis (strain CIRAD86) TaxID=383855 RepID=M3AQ65_PSEFD|nr:uncharacterized protein MYCFIDRAFT_172432 [Pseudocercospora fijiensis CIRAD86]EME86736.1 hypothetical protein MYCFIDRAFT_172432 [Pseudocercospora fijiensis CIRAD86]
MEVLPLSGSRISSEYGGKRLALQFFEHGAPRISSIAIALLATPSLPGQINSRDGAGKFLLIYSLIAILGAPDLVRFLDGGKFWNAQPWLFGFEGHLNMEKRIFGTPLRSLQCAPYSSPLSRHHPNTYGECVGVDPTTGPETARIARNAAAWRLEVFTIVDTENMEVTMFQAGRPPRGKWNAKSDTRTQITFCNYFLTGKNSSLESIPSYCETGLKTTTLCRSFISIQQKDPGDDRSPSQEVIRDQDLVRKESQYANSFDSVRAAAWKLRIGRAEVENFCDEQCRATINNNAGIKACPPGPHDLDERHFLLFLQSLKLKPHAPPLAATVPELPSRSLQTSPKFDFLTAIRDPGLLNNKLASHPGSTPKIFGFKSRAYAVERAGHGGSEGN